MEREPLLPSSTARLPSSDSDAYAGEGAMPSDLETKTDGKVSYAGLAGSSLYGSQWALIGQFGLLSFALVLAITLWLHPAGLFSYHPSLQLVAVVGFAEGVLVLQPTRTPDAKRVGLILHQVFQFGSLFAIVAGTYSIWYNKASHSAPHATSWHGLFGYITVGLLLVQAIAGGAVTHWPLNLLFGGELKAKAMWKFHRAAGYAVTVLLLFTPFLAMDSDWVVGHTSVLQRNVMRAGLVGTGVAVFARLSPTKLGIKRA